MRIASKTQMLSWPAAARRRACRNWIAAVLRARALSGGSDQAIREAIGLTPEIYRCIARGRRVPEADFRKACLWLGEDPAHFGLED